MVNYFVCSDPLHLLDLGIMRKYLLRWVYGENGYNRKWCKVKARNTSILLENGQKFMPSEIHRAVRNLDCLRKWKRVEYRSFLLYVGMVVLKPVLNEAEYNHFLILMCATRICNSKSYKNYFGIADKMFKLYVQKYIALYGQHAIGSNVHLLCHVVDEMNQNEIDNIMLISTYKYENHLRLLGLKIQSGYLPLEQVAKRCIEISQFEKTNDIREIFEPKKDSPKVFYEKKIDGAIIWNKIQISLDLTLSNRKKADSLFLSTNDEIVRMVYIIKDKNEFKIVGKSIPQKINFFSNPMSHYVFL